MKKQRILTDFAIGITVGFSTAVIIFGFVLCLAYVRNKDKELANHVREYAEKQIEIEVLREDYGNRDFTDFLETVPDVRRAADGAADDFIRRRDEILHRFRNRIVD